MVRKNETIPANTPENNNLNNNNNTNILDTEMAGTKRPHRTNNRNDTNGTNISPPQTQHDGTSPDKNVQLRRNRERTKTKPAFKLKPINPITRTNKISKSIKNILKQKFLTKKCFVINIELLNGKHRTMLLTTKEGTFKYDGGTYIIDTNLAYDNIDSKFLWLDYFQGFSMPIKRNFAQLSLELQEGIEQSGLYDIEGCTNPMTLRRCLEAKISEGIAKSTGIPEFLKRLNFFVIISMIAVIILLILFVLKTGMLQSIKIPGIT